VAKDGELADKVWMPDHTDPTDLAAGDNESPDAAEQAAVGHTDPPPSPQPEEEAVPDAPVLLRAVPLSVRPPAASAFVSRGPAASMSAPKPRKRTIAQVEAALKKRRRKEAQQVPKAAG
jgi:hypothetical protein